MVRYRTYLQREYAGLPDVRPLFEGRGHLPLFWLILFEPADLEALESNAGLRSVIPWPRARHNAQRYQPQWAAQSPEASALLDQWLAELEQLVPSDGLIALDLSELALLKQDRSELIARVQLEQRLLTWQLRQTAPRPENLIGRRRAAVEGRAPALKSSPSFQLLRGKLKILSLVLVLLSATVLAAGRQDMLATVLIIALALSILLVLRLGRRRGMLTSHEKALHSKTP